MYMNYDGIEYETRADIMYTRPDYPGWFGVVEVKTGVAPELTDDQKYIIPGIADGYRVNIWAAIWK